MNRMLRLARILWLAVGALLVLLVLASCGTNTPPDLESTTPASHSALTASPTTTSPPTQKPLPSPTKVAASTVKAVTDTVTPTTELLPTPTASVPPPTTTPTPTMEPPLPVASPEPQATLPIPVPTLTSPPEPQVLSFTVTPTTTQNVGEELWLAWNALGQEAAICPLVGGGPVESECQDVSLQDEMTLTIGEASMQYIGFALRVQAGDSTIWSVVNTHLQCQNLREWFFDDPPERCPEGLALHSYAAGQYFERGFMVWVENTDEFYVFYKGPDAQGFQTFERQVGLQLKPGASQDNRVPEEPPPGYLQPVSGFGLLWRGEVENPVADVRQRLGWATGPEFGYDTAYQCATRTHPRSWSCYLRGPSGELLHLHPDSTAQVRLLWETE